MNKKKTRYRIFILLILILITGCTVSKKRQVNENKKNLIPQTLTYCTWEDERSYTEKLVNSFMAEHPDITVKVQYIDEDMTGEKASQLLEKNEIDIIGLKNINDVARLKKEKKIIDITEKIESSGINVACYGNMYGDISLDGTYWCMPTRKTSWVLFYNKDIFEKEKIKEPGQLTWDEFAKLAKKLTEDDTQWGCYFVNWVYNFMGIQKKNYLYDDDLTYLKKSLDFFQRIYFEDESSMSPEEMQDKNWLETFESGQVAMMPMGEWFVGMILADEKTGKSNVNWDIAPMPVVKGQKSGTTWGTYQFVSISNVCEEQQKSDAAFEFVKFLCGGEGARIYAANGMIPAYINSDIEKIYCDAVGEHHAEVFFDAYQIQEMPVYDGYETLENMLEKEANQSLIEKEQNIESVMQNFEKERQKFLQ